MITITEGWVFYSADFSLQATTKTYDKGVVVLKRNLEQTALWSKLSDEEQDTTDLYVGGFGITIEEAIEDANRKAKQIGLLI